jgi:hypothetical protein
MSNEYKVGQKFWWVSNDANVRTQREVIVEKVGRVWVTLSNGYRVDKVTRAVERQEWGTAIPGVCWPSKEEFERHDRTEKAWTTLQRKVRETWRIPDDVTLEDIKAAAMYLKLEIKI